MESGNFLHSTSMKHGVKKKDFTTTKERKEKQFTR